MIDILPGYASDLTAYEEAVQAAIDDGWQIKGYSIAWNGTDTLLTNELWKEGAPPALTAPPESWGPSYGVKRAIQRAAHVEKLAAFAAEKEAKAKLKTARKAKPA